MLSKLNGQDQRARWTNRITEFGIRDIMIVEELYGNRKLALVIIDAQRKFCNDRPDWKVACEDMVRRINRLIYAFRKAGAPIISVQYEGNTFCRPYEGTDGDEYFRGLAIRPDDITVVKRNMNGFNETDLKKILDAVNVDKILLVGTVTQYCVMSTYFSCFDNHIIPYLGEKATVTTDDSIRDAAEVVCKTLAEGFVFDTLGVPRLGDEVPVFTEAAVPLWDPSRLCDIAALANSGGGHFVVGYPNGVKDNEALAASIKQEVREQMDMDIETEPIVFCAHDAVDVIVPPSGKKVLYAGQLFVSEAGFEY